MVSRVNHRLFILRRYMKLFKRKTLQQMYISYIRPLLEYGSTVWTYLSLHESESLEEIQRAGIRIVTGLKSGTEHLALYRELDLPPLSHRRFVSRMATLHDILNCDVEGRLNRETVTATHITREGVETCTSIYQELNIDADHSSTLQLKNGTNRNPQYKMQEAEQQ